jgi:type IV secretion system protein VirB1
LVAVAQTESHLDPLAVHDNTTHRSYSPATKADAVLTAQQLITEGHNLDLGMMQINTGNLGWLRLTIERAFDPCQSLKAGAAVLTAISRYNTGSHTAGFSNGYVRRVLTALHELPSTNSPRAQINAVPRGGDIPPGSGANARWNPFLEPASTPLELTFRTRKE